MVGQELDRDGWLALRPQATVQRCPVCGMTITHVQHPSSGEHFYFHGKHIEDASLVFDAPSIIEALASKAKPNLTDQIGSFCRGWHGCENDRRLQRLAKSFSTADVPR